MEIFLKISVVLLIALALTTRSTRESMRSRNLVDWSVDLVSMFIQIFALPLLSSAFLIVSLNAIIPEWKGTLNGGIWLSLALVMLLDYGWYWNHRLFHLDTPIWKFHKIHHSPKYVDVFITSRNSVPSHFLMVYFWFTGLFLYLLADPVPFLTLSAIGVLHNNWVHTSFVLKPGSFSEKFLSFFFITPIDHHWHHSGECKACNFASTFSFWDRLHRTLYRPGRLPLIYGDGVNESLLRQLFFPR